MDLLAVDKAHLSAFVNQQSSRLSLDGDFIAFTPNSQNQAIPKKFKENISFENMLPVMSLLTNPN
jgi:hypothetical protein